MRFSLRTTLLVVAILVVVAFVAAAFTKKPPIKEGEWIPDEIKNPPKPELKITLSWEKDKPERAEWTKYVVDTVRVNLSLLNKAKDMDRFCPKYKTLDEDHKTWAWAELISAMALYESSWNPKSASVDVGKPDQKDTWSVGLLQMSVIDQKSYNIDLGYKYADLLTPKPNLHLGLSIMIRQVDRKNMIALSSGVYWAVIKEGGKYSKIPQISSMVKKVPGCL